MEAMGFSAVGCGGTSRAEGRLAGVVSAVRC